MKNNKYLFLIYASFIICSCNDSAEKLKAIPLAHFSKDTFDFKKIKKGSVIDVSFALKNTGKADLFVLNTSVGCGCTKIKPIKDAIGHDETVDIKLTYDSKKDSGNVLKTIVVETNTNPKIHVLYIKGLVE